MFRSKARRQVYSDSECSHWHWHLLVCHGHLTHLMNVNASSMIGPFIFFNEKKYTHDTQAPGAAGGLMIMITKSTIPILRNRCPATAKSAPHGSPVISQFLMGSSLLVLPWAEADADGRRSATPISCGCFFGGQRNPRGEQLGLLELSGLQCTAFRLSLTRNCGVV